MKFILTKLMDDPRPHWALSNDFFVKRKKKWILHVNRDFFT